MSDKQVCDRCETEAQREDNCGYYLSAFYIRAACTHQNTAPQSSTAKSLMTAPSQEGVGQGETASAVPTPLTDAQAKFDWGELVESAPEFVSADFARQLERALAISNEAYECLEGHWKADKRCDFPEHSRPSAEAGKLLGWLRDNAPDCGDNSCLFGGRGKGGMRTNGGCRCFKDLPTGKRIYVERLSTLLDLSALSGDAAPGGDGWLPIETAPKGGGAPLRTDPAWVEPPKILLLFAGGAQAVCYWDWYYAEGGAGCTDGVAWIEPVSGERINLHYDNPIRWRPLLAAPGGGGKG